MTTKDPWRPIIFEGFICPKSLMALTVLFSALPLSDACEGWILQLCACKGVVKQRSAEECRKFAEETSDAILSQHQELLKHVENVLGEYHFDPAGTLREWLTTLDAIQRKAEQTEGLCTWTSPADPGEGKALDQISRISHFLDSRENDAKE